MSGEDQVPRARLVDRYVRLLEPTTENVRNLRDALYPFLHKEYYGRLHSNSKKSLFELSHDLAELVYKHLNEMFGRVDENDKR
jgi:hypothetical protein